MHFAEPIPVVITSELARRITLAGLRPPAPAPDRDHTRAAG